MAKSETLHREFATPRLCDVTLKRSLITPPTHRKDQRGTGKQCGAPRFVFTDFPLGNPCGKPDDSTMQRAIVGIALDLLETARHARTTVQTPFYWDSTGEWRDTYMQIPNVRAEKPPLTAKAERSDWENQG